jgi:hypothetical protein
LLTSRIARRKLHILCGSILNFQFRAPQTDSPFYL